MPFQSEKQRRYLWANEPEIARDWADTYGSRIKKDDGGISQLVKSGPGRPGYQGPAGGASAGGDYGGNVNPDQEYAGRAYRDQPYASKESIEKGDKQMAANKALAILAADEKEEKVEKFRSQQGLFKNKKTRDFFLNKVWQAQKGMFKGIDLYNLSDQEQEDLYEQYMSERMAGRIDAYGNPTGGGGGGGSYYPRDVHPGTGTEQITTEVVEPISDFQKSLTGNVETPDYYVGENPLASNLAWGQAYGVDPRTMGLTSWAAEGGRIPAAFGGIMDSSTGRRAYGLGSIFKSIKKAASKVLKSPVGKAVLLGGLGMYGANAGWFGATNPFFGKTGHLAPFLRQKTKEGFGKYSLAKLGILGAGALPFFMGQPDEDEDEGFDYDAAKQLYADEIMRIKRGALAGSLDPNKFNYLGVKDGGRIGYYAGGQSTPSDYTMEVALMTTTQDKLGGITDVMKHADLYRQGSVGQFYAADGGRIGADEGGLMDMGGMEKDYRNDGGFVPIGGEEKADDVPARLSRNEFVFTADAVRGAGGGDIDAGAEIMENVMKNLEQGGQVSDETQGLAGAQEMFDVSERLSEVV